MKTFLTVIFAEKSFKPAEQSMHDGTEHINMGENDDKGAFLYQAVKAAKGKYTVIFENDFSYADAHSFIVAAEGQNADVICFNRGYCFKTALLRGLPQKAYADKYSLDFIAAMNAKTVAKINVTPFIVRGGKGIDPEESEKAIYCALDEFSKCKAKLQKEVYNFTFEILLSRLMAYYVGACLALREKKYAYEKLEKLDAALKENIVLYLAFEKRFNDAVCDIKKLRKNKFAVSFFSVGKFKQLLRQLT